MEINAPRWLLLISDCDSKALVLPIPTMLNHFLEHYPGEQLNKNIESWMKNQGKPLIMQIKSDT